jgi:hypothetical protein
MKKITLDAVLAGQLHELQQAAELCDPSGKVIGMFEPVFDPTKWEIIGPEITDEELDRRANSNENRFTTEEVLAYLKSLERQ